MSLNFFIWFYFVVFLIAPILSVESHVTCQNDDGKNVEWYIMYKLPRLHEIGEKGTEYLYMDHETPSWSKSKHTVDENTSAVGRTLTKMYSSPSNNDLIILQYNDEWPDGKHKSFTRGHTKGVFLGDATSGFWLVHSVPKYPPWSNTSYDYPSSGHMYGQTYLCISVSPTQYDLIGLQLLYNTPYVYDFNMPESLSQKFPNLYKAMKSKHVTTPPWYHEQNFSGISGTKFISFAKSAKFQNDLYSAFLAPSLKIHMVTETWQNGRGYLESACKQKYTVRNIRAIDFINNSVEYNSTHDHSKWAISLNELDPWVCVGDINRMITQFKRGGGTVCMKNQNVWKTFDNIVFRTDACKIWK